MTSALEFYSERIKNFENERSLFEDHIKMISPDKGELHILEWDCRKQEDDNKLALSIGDDLDNEKRKLLISLQEARSELDELKNGSEARLAQIQRLSELAQPVQRDTTYLFMNKNNNAAIPTLTTSSSSSTAIAAASKSEGISKFTLKQEKTIEEENRKVDVHLKNLSYAIKDAENILSINKKTAESNVVHEVSKEARKVIKEADRLDYSNFLAVSELLVLRLKILIAQREEIEELDSLNVDQSFFHKKEQQTREQLLSDMNMMKRRLKFELQACSKDFEYQLSSLTSRCESARKQEEAENAEYERMSGKSDDLRKDLDTAKAKYEKLRRRNALEMEGYHNEMKQLRQRLTQLEKLAATSSA